MSAILVTTLVLAAIGLVCGVALAAVAKKFAVPENPLVGEILALLPGANCGGCGRPGCDGYARDIAENGAPLNLCTACNADMLAAREALTGRAGGAVAEKRVALVRCTGGFDAATRRFDYNGLADCAAAQAVAGGDKGCSYGCLGYGSCVRVCQSAAISVVNGVAVVDPAKCGGCGACVRACPRHVIELVPASHKVHVLCVSKDRGPAVRKVCTNGCLGCGLCAKLAPEGAVKLDGFLASVDYSKPPMGEEAASKIREKCPTKCFGESKK